VDQVFHVDQLLDERAIPKEDPDMKFLYDLLSKVNWKKRTRCKLILECPPPYKELDEAPLNEVASSVAAKEVNKFSKTAQV